MQAGATNRWRLSVVLLGLWMGACAGQNTVVVLDRSRSMAATDPDLRRYDSVKLIELILGNDLSSLAVVFGSTARVVHVDDIRNYPPAGGTSIRQGLRAALDSVGSVRNILLLTDGMDTSLSVDSMVRLAGAVRVFPVGLSDGVQEDALSSLGARTGGAYIRAWRADDLPSSFGRLAMMVRGDECAGMSEGTNLAVPIEQGARKVTVIAGRRGRGGALTIAKPDSGRRAYKPDVAIGGSEYWCREFVAPSRGAWTTGWAGARGSSTGWVQVWVTSNLSCAMNDFPEDAAPAQLFRAVLKCAEDGIPIPAITASGRLHDGASVVDSFAIAQADRGDFEEFERLGGYPLRFMAPRRPGDYSLAIAVRGLSRRGTPFQRYLTHTLHVKGATFKNNPFADNE